VRAALTAAGGGTLASVAAVGWSAVVLLIALGGLVLAAGVWVLRDDQRTRRLATLLGRGRDDAQPPTS
jgi:HAMP domain-containing protein